MKRRDFIGTAVVGATTLAAASHAEGEKGTSEKSIDTSFLKERVTLGQSGLKVSRVGLGSGMTGGMRRSNQVRMGEKNFRDLIRYAYDQGINFFDTADLYGTHRDIMPGLEGVPREEVTIVSKIWWAPGGIPEKERLMADELVERFLKELNTDYIDLLHLHCVTSKDWPKELAKQMDVMSKLKEEGKIRAHGVSVHSLEALEVAAEHPWVDAVHTRINPYEMAMDGPPEKVVPILKKMHANGKGVTGMKMIGEGRLRDDPEKKMESVKFVYGLGCVDTVIVGFESKEEVDDTLAMVGKALA
ncbi:MAG: aldo/keto reductase [Candidatus Omnitrophica bacterium]|nr:aldo/keto reductase [Candidatus Omnitrophota bacterium]MCB9769501.1 aldo/keto reductase [Candidatus Omnitrophota bacterium]